MAAVPIQKMSVRTPLRRDPTVAAGFILATASVIVGVIGLLGTLSTAHQPSPARQGVSLFECMVLAENYRQELTRYPLMIGALRSIVERDPEAQRCGINSATLTTMLPH